MSTSIAFLGTGIMGTGMARRLLGAGFPVTVYNRTPDHAASVVEAGARLAKTPADAAAGADVLIAMLSDDVASREIWLGHHGALTTARPGTICIECSTLTVPWVRELAADCTARQLLFLDAPVLGSKPQAASGQLIFLVGGSANALEAVRPVFAPMAKDVVPLGPVGSGTMVKLLNNFLAGVQAASFAEALALLQRSGVNPQAALAVITEGTPGSPMVKTMNTRHAARDYSPNFPLRLMAKDLAYVLAEGKHHGLTLQTATAALFRFTQAAQSGLGDQDISALLKFLEQTSHA
jgi:3-hydroxyisobutyrate dehydrogenase